jgi:polar amino acid transport system substrate-binding protein
MQRSDLPISRRRVLLGLGAVGAGLCVAGLPRRAHAALTLDAIRKAGALRIAVEATFPPFAMRKDGEIVGYDVDFANLFCKDLGVKPAFVDQTWAGVIPALYAGRFDLIMTSLSYTAERVKRVAFTIPYAEASQAMLIRAADADKIKGVDDLVGKTLGIKLGSPGEVLHRKIEADLKARKGAGYKEVRFYDDHPSAYIALAQNKVDAVFNTISVLAIVLRDAPGRYAIVRGLGADNWAGMASRLEEADLIGFLNEEIRKYKADGQIYALQDKWFGFRMNLPDAVPTF